MIEKKPAPGNGRIRVEFSLPHTTRAERINVVGEFNDWDTTATPMSHARSTAEWKAAIELEVGRRYRFRYLLDGKHWFNDWYADDYEDNLYGTRDSVVDLTEFADSPLA